MLHNLLVGLISEWTSSVVFFIFESHYVGRENRATVSSSLLMLILSKLAFTFLGRKVEEV